MRLLADESLNKLEVDLLRTRGHDLVWIEEETPGVDDQTVLSHATAEKRILLTADKGHFGRLVFIDKQKAPYGIILFRIQKSPSERAKIMVTAIESRIDWERHFSVVRDVNSIRMTPLPID
ncbi:hypothetical protein F4X73_11100 [Candidatus Poribacteria bacterium]|nr:hypothetical protein [Candidatus Poribacteria bacterium]MYF56843.1 hypothetical protein [Candidatus Poribacteria bacterium]